MADLPNHHRNALSLDIDADPEIAAIRDGRDGTIPVKSGGISTTTSNSATSSACIPGTFHDIDSDDELAIMNAGDLPIQTGGISMGTFVPSLPHREMHDIDSDDELLAVRDSGLTKTGGRKRPGPRRTGGPSARYKQEPDIDSGSELAAKRQEGNGGDPIKSKNDVGSTSTSAKSAKSTGPKELKAKRKPPSTPKVASSSSAKVFGKDDEGLRGRQRKQGLDIQQPGPTMQRRLRTRAENETNDDLLRDSWTVPVSVAIGLMMCTPFMMMLLALWWNNSSKKG